MHVFGGKIFLAGGEQAVFFSGSDDDLETTGYKQSGFTNVTISSPVEALASGSFRWALISTEMKKNPGFIDTRSKHQLNSSQCHPFLHRVPGGCSQQQPLVRLPGRTCSGYPIAHGNLNTVSGATMPCALSISPIRYVAKNKSKKEG